MATTRPRSGGAPLPPAVDRPDLGPLAAAGADELGPRAELLGRELTDLVLDGVDLRHSTFEECRLAQVRVVDADLTGLRLRDCALTGWDAPALTAPRTDWRDVELTRSRLGGVELYQATWRSVRVTESKLGFVNLRGATLTDMIIADCQVDELDLSGATLARVSLAGCRIGQLTLTDARLEDVDLRGAELAVLTGLDGLRGAVVDQEQLTLLAPLLAAHLGLVVL